MSSDCIDNHVTLPSDGYSRMARVGIKSPTDCTRVLRRLFTLHYCTIVAVPATSDTARLSLFTLRRRRIAVRGGVAMRKSAKHSLFVTNFQTVIVVYKEVLS